MNTLEYELEMEAWPALGSLEGEGEWEEEWEGEAESEEFFRRLAGLARRAVASPALRNVALSAARGALSGLGGMGAAVGSRIGGARGSALGQDLGAAVGRHASGWLPQQEFEGEDETAWEVNPIQRIYPDALMEHLGHAAAQAEDEAEAEAFLGALIPLAARLLPRVAPTLLRATPQLVSGIASAGRALRANPATRPLVRALPAVVQQTAASLARQTPPGQVLPPQAAVATLARQTARVLGNPQACVRAYQRSKALDRRFHRATAPTAPSASGAPCAPCASCAATPAAAAIR